MNTDLGSLQNECENGATEADISAKQVSFWNLRLLEIVLL